MKMMMRFATLLIVLSACSIAWAGGCQPGSAGVHSDEPLDFQVYFENKPAAAVLLQLYAGDKLVHSAMTDQTGWVRLGIFPPGKYRAVIPHRGTLDIVVFSRKSNLNGPIITWIFPKYKWVAGKKVAGIPCPWVGMKSD